VSVIPVLTLNVLSTKTLTLQKVHREFAKVIQVKDVKQKEYHT